MATRVGQLFTWSMGVTDAHMEKLPKGAIAKQVVTETQDNIGITEVTLAGFTVVPTIAGQGARQLRVTAVGHFKPSVGLSVSGSAVAGNNHMTVRVRRGSATGDVVAFGIGPTPSSAVSSTIIASGLVSVSPGDATFVVTAEGYGLATWETTCSSSRPGSVCVEDLGPSF